MTEKKDKKVMQLKNKIVLGYILLGIIPCILIGIGSYLVYSRSINSKIEAIVDNNAQRDLQVIEERLKSNRNILYNIVTDRELLKLVRKMDQAGREGEYTYKSKILEKIQSFTSIYDNVNSITYLSDSDEYILYDKRLGRLETIWNNRIYRDYFYLNVWDQDEVVYLPTLCLTENREEKIYSFFLSYPLKDAVTKEKFGIIVVGVDEDMFHYTKISNNQMKKYMEELGITTYVIDKRSKVIAAENRELIGSDFETAANAVGNGSNHRIFFNEIEGTGWQLVQVIDKTLLFQDVTFFRQISFLIVAVIMGSFTLLTVTITNRLSRSIIKTARYIEEYQPGETKVLPRLEEKDELVSIIYQFDKMRGKNEKLIQELKDKNYEIMTMSNRQRKAELKALEAQINPHFLYNTLDSINWIAIENDQEEISQMLSSLGSLLRYSVTNIDMQVPLEVELEWMKKYTFLQQKRFNDSFVCQYDIEEESLNYPIYKMLLQPIIENIILHGFQDKKQGGVISVKAEVLEDGKLMIFIEDNGCGIKPDILKRIHNDISNKTPLNSESIGISNIVNRTNLYYKGEAQIQIESEPGRGTKVVLMIP